MGRSGALPASNAWWALVTLGVVHTGVVFTLLYGAIQRLPVLLVGSLSFIYPVVAMLVDRVAFGQRLGPLQMFGMASVLGAAAASTLGWPREKTQKAGGPGSTQAGAAGPTG